MGLWRSKHFHNKLSSGSGNISQRGSGGRRNAFRTPHVHYKIEDISEELRMNILIVQRGTRHFWEYSRRSTCSGRQSFGSPDKFFDRPLGGWPGRQVRR